MLSELERTIAEDQRSAIESNAQGIFRTLIQKNQYVGEVYSIGYEAALVQIHDRHRMDVGGIPSLSFLIATRVNPEQLVDYKTEDASVILLRVMDAAPLPNDFEAQRIRVEAAQRASESDGDLHWDSPETMDTYTHRLLSYAGVKCRVIGTFFLDQNPDSEAPESLILRFGSDLSNYYPNRGLKVYKPNDRALSMIVNYRDPDRKDIQIQKSVVIGKIRYASTNRSFQGISDVEVSLLPGDLLGQKTALFGMTRTGKSNTVKIIAKSVYELRYPDNLEEEVLKIGQIIFDPNGEYANENVQDLDGQGNTNALKNVYKVREDAKKEDEIVTYGITQHPNDPDRKLMLLNFYLDENLQIGKEIIDSFFQEKESKFIDNFKQVVFERPDEQDRSAFTRFKRRRLAYLCLLAKAGFDIPPQSKNFNYSQDGLFNREMFEGRPNARDEAYRFNGMLSVTSEPDKADLYKSAAETFRASNPSLIQLADAFIILNDFMKTSEYRRFEQWYSEKKSSTGSSWADEDLKKILLMLAQPNGARQIGKARPFHTRSTSSDYAEDIYRALESGKLVIIDQSSGEPEINKSSADRIMWTIFRKNQEFFRKGEKNIPNIIVYIEEAHNLLPSGSNLDLSDVWVRTAKEGAKYSIGMVYSTQEVSSIQKNILKNTANWFIGHLNNTDETKELCKYYDFDDFESSIRRAQDRGFLRVKTLSNLFVIPVQIKKFEV
jgi:DNA helicase HerA-like ATPase